MSKCAEKAINDHNFDFLSLEFAYAGNMRKNMPHICGICSIYAAYAAYMPHICAAYFAKFRIFFPHNLPPNFPHILRKFYAINQHP